MVEIAFTYCYIYKYKLRGRKGNFCETTLDTSHEIDCIEIVKGCLGESFRIRWLWI